MSRFDPIDRKDFEIIGREYEDFYCIYNKDGSVMPMIVDCAGVTHPMSNYLTKRSDSNFYAFEFIISGKGYLTYNNNKFVIKKGDFICLEPHSKQCLFSDKDNPLYKYFVVFYCDVFGSALKGLNLSNITVFEGFDAKSEMSQICELAKNVPNNDYLCYPVLTLVMSLLVKLSQFVHNIIHEKSKITISETAKQTKQKLDDSLTRPINIETIAKSLFTSRSTVNREFIKAYGVSPYQYLLNNRIELAKNLLRNTNYQIREIAAMLSFSDAYYFSNIFSKKTGCSPSEYRKPQQV